MQLIKRSKTNFNKIVLISLILGIILIILTILIITSLYIIAFDVGYAYAMMIDAGSTSSKITIFRWKDWPFRTNGWIEEINHMKISPGISDYTDNPTAAFMTMKPTLLNMIKSYIPISKISSTRVYLGATAGMRHLRYASATIADKIIEVFRDELPRLGLEVKNRSSDIRIITGREEGLFSWVTVNYLDKRLGDQHERQPNNDGTIIGALDLGGASTQITFVPGSDARISNNISITLFKKKYNLFTYSFVCYGKSMIKHRLWAKIINDQIQNSTQPTFENPCLLKGNTVKIQTSKLYTPPCVLSKFANETFGFELIPDKKLSSTVELVGTGQPDLCRAYIEDFFKPIRQCNSSSCFFNGAEKAPIRGKFYAFAGFSYVIDFLNFTNGGSGLSRNSVKARVNNYCTENWTQIAAKNKKFAHYFAGFCYDGIYIDSLLSQFGFTSTESWKDINFVNKVAGVTVSWAIGYIVDASGKINSLEPRIYISESAFVCSLIILALIVIAIITGIIYFKRQ